MKQKDIVLIIVVAAVSLVLASVLSSLLFSGSSSNRQLTAEQVQPISGNLDSPSSQYFNSESVNPTETIRIEDNSNQSPFNQSQ